MMPVWTLIEQPSVNHGSAHTKTKGSLIGNETSDSKGEDPQMDWKSMFVQ